MEFLSKPNTSSSKDNLFDRLTNGIVNEEAVDIEVDADPVQDIVIESKELPPLPKLKTEEYAEQITTFTSITPTSTPPPSTSDNIQSNTLQYNVEETNNDYKPSEELMGFDDYLASKKTKKRSDEQDLSKKVVWEGKLVMPSVSKINVKFVEMESKFGDWKNILGQSGVLTIQ